MLASLLFGACQAYAPLPYDPSVHEAEWEGRPSRLASRQPIAEESRPRLTSVLTAAQDFDPRDGLDLREGEWAALVHHPDLRRARQALQGSAQVLEASGLWLDPQFQSNLLRIRDAEGDASVLTPNLSFSLPLTGQVDAGRAAATASQELELARVLEAEWRVIQEVRGAWARWTAADQEVRVLEEAQGVLAGLATTARELTQRGELSATEAASFRIELAACRSALAGARGAVEGLRAELLGVLGLAPTADLVLHPAALGSSCEPLLAEASRVLREPDAPHPLLQRIALEHQLAERKLALEIARQIPDPLVGPMFETDGGQVRWGLTITSNLLFWNGNRLAIAAAKVVRGGTHLEIGLHREGLATERVASLRRLEGLRSQVRSIEEELLPEVMEQARVARELLMVGEGSASALLEAVDRLQQERLALASALLDLELEAAQLCWALGPGWARKSEVER